MSRRTTGGRSNLDSAELQKIETFRDVCGPLITDAEVIALLQKSSWDVDRAADTFFSTYGATGSPNFPSSNNAGAQIAANTANKFDPKRIEDLFLRFATHSNRVANLRKDSLPSSRSSISSSYADANRVVSGRGSGENSGVPKTRKPDTRNHVIDIKGIRKLSEALDIDVCNVELLALAYMCECTIQGEISYDEFFKGMTKLECDNIEKLRDWAQTAGNITDDIEKLRQLYLFTFPYSVIANKKHLNIDIAIAYWRLLLLKVFPLIDKWIEFMELHKESIVRRYVDGVRKARALHRTETTDETVHVPDDVYEAVSRDLWLMLYDLCNLCKGDADVLKDSYDPNGAWPVLIDEFVNWLYGKSK